MRTDDLIDELAATVRPVSARQGLRRLLLSLVLGGLASSMLIVAWLGPPLQAIAATGIAAFSIKLAFGIAMLAFGGFALLRAGQPGHSAKRLMIGLAIPPLVIAAMAIADIAGGSIGEAKASLFGSTWQTCLASIMVLSLPVLAGAIIAFRRLAPTRLALAGFLAGAASGSMAAIVYALYCPETAPLFLLAWYSLGIAMSAALGALLGPRLLHW